MTDLAPLELIPGAPTVTLTTSPITTFQSGDDTIQYAIANESEGTVLDFNFAVEGEIPEAGLKVKVVNIEAIIPGYSYLSQLDISQAVTTSNNEPVFDEANDTFSLTITEPETTLSIPILADGIDEESQTLDFALGDVENRNYNAPFSFNPAILIDDVEDLPSYLTSEESSNSSTNPEVSLIIEPEPLIESESTSAVLNFNLSEPPPPEGITVTINATDLRDFNLGQTEVEGGEIVLEAELVEQLDTNLEDTRAPEVPGAAVAIVSPSGSYFGASGVASLEDDTPLQPGDRFEIGSITKTFTATVILQLVEEGILSLDDALTDWLPEDVTANIPNADDITLEQLLQHTSGVADYVDILFNQAATNPLVFAQDWQPEQLVELIDGQEPPFEPGEAFNYSNTNFLLLGIVIEAATDNNIAAEIRDRITDPLELENTFFAGEEEIPGGYVSGYWDFDQNGSLNNINVANLSWAWSTGAIVSNTEDLDTFARNLFDGDLLQPETLAQMLDTIPATDNDNYSSYGLGVGTIESPNRLWYIHRGQTLGYRSNMWYSPQDDLTYIELINGFSSDNLVRDILPAYREGINDGSFEFTITEQEASITILVLDDGETEGEETASFTLKLGEGYAIDPDNNGGEFSLVDNANTTILDPEQPLPEPEANNDLEFLFGTLTRDIIEVAGQEQLIFAGNMNDLVDASTGEGNNRIYAGNGDDTLILGKSDRVFAGVGDDAIFATSAGDNTITGGSGADQFWIAAAEPPDTANIITDFTLGEDVIGIAGLGIGFSDVAITQVEADALISVNNFELAILQDIEAGSLSASNFAFV
ncbi:MAG: serine hydrolase [Cyanobacteria bacterium J06600_6]